MEMTTRNLSIEARRVQNSLRFLLSSPVNRMRMAAMPEIKTAHRGRVEETTSISDPQKTQSPAGMAN
jgi:hypothetical protein